ncbi:MAG: helix-turn-helix transcriptional regulator [Candidatus Accumulibacter sp.]|nr:helix-turn-helix transcriptional regulator [Accumulibacter sp.]
MSSFRATCVDLAALERICMVLGCGLGELLEIVPDEPPQHDNVPFAGRHVKMPMRLSRWQDVRQGGSLRRRGPLIDRSRCHRFNAAAGSGRGLQRRRRPSERLESDPGALVDRRSAAARPLAQRGASRAPGGDRHRRPWPCDRRRHGAARSGGGRSLALAVGHAGRRRTPFRGGSSEDACRQRGGLRVLRARAPRGEEERLSRRRIGAGGRGAAERLHAAQQGVEGLADGPGAAARLVGAAGVCVAGSRR